jgi:nicotinamide riboside transporter PnuC
VIEVVIRLLMTALGLRQLKEDLDEAREDAREAPVSWSRRLGQWSRRCYVACAIVGALYILAIAFQLSMRTLEGLLTLIFIVGAISVGLAMARGFVEGHEKARRKRSRNA